MSTTTQHKTPWLALTNLPRIGMLESSMDGLQRWLEENPGEHEERRALVQSLHASLDRVRREVLTAHWILGQAIEFKPMEDL